MSALWYSNVFPQIFTSIKIKFADMTKIRANFICGIEQCGHLGMVDECCRLCFLMVVKDLLSWRLVEVPNIKWSNVYRKWWVYSSLEWSNCPETPAYRLTNLFFFSKVTNEDRQIIRKKISFGNNDNVFRNAIAI